MGSGFSNTMRTVLLVISCLLLAIGNCGGVLIARLYFVQGGSRVWLSTWLMTGGWPLILPALAISYFCRRKTHGPATKIIVMKPGVFIDAVIVGVILGLNNFVTAFGVERLPVSTASLILSTALLFTALCTFFIVKQRFTFYSVNAIVLLTVGAAVLALRAGSERPAGQRYMAYVVGFLMMVAGAALSGLYFPLIERAYKKAKQTVTYTVVMEFAMVMCLTATIFATVGMVINRDFQAIPREARAYKIGEGKYYLVLVANVVIWQFFNWGTAGVICYASALVSGILFTVTLPLSQVLAVVFFKDKFTAEKGVSLLLCIWGFVSYYYGDYINSKKHQAQEESQVIPGDSSNHQDEISPDAAP